jgi:malate dehydrogenase (oxaloacetate-decarboxylating)
VKLLHRPGQLAKLSAVLAEHGALIGEITTVHLGAGTSTRDVTVDTVDDDHTKRVVDTVSHVAGITLHSVTDRVFDTHRGGKLHSTSRVELRQLGDLRTLYTPGVARVAQALVQEPRRAWDLTGLGNSVGIFTNGSRALGLGNVGPVASLPVMEGKAVLYDKLIGISATPILVDTLDATEFVEAVRRVPRTFGGIHLEDIRIPECFLIEAGGDHQRLSPDR